MSSRKIDRNFPINLRTITDPELAEIIAQALRDDFGDGPSAIKQIGQITSANLRAIRNWYDGKNVPNSRYLLILARSSPSILQLTLTQIGGEDLWDVFQLFSNKDSGTEGRSNPAKSLPRIGSTNVPINVPINLNARQAWFVEQLSRNPNLRAIDIVHSWKTTLKTARRDIMRLKIAGKIKFVGALKTGKYVFS